MCMGMLISYFVGCIVRHTIKLLFGYINKIIIFK